MILGLLLYIAVFALVSPLLGRTVPALFCCHYKARTGEPCPFCGLTGDMRRYLTTGGNAEHTNPAFPELAKLYLIILAARTVFTMASLKSGMKSIPWLDAAFHLVLLSTAFLG